MVNSGARCKVRSAGIRSRPSRSAMTCTGSTVPCEVELGTPHPALRTSHFARVAHQRNARDLAPMADVAAFESEVLPHLDTLYRVGRRLTGETADAEDLVQETLLRAWRGWAGFTTGSNVRAWLLTILRNTFVSRWSRW